MYEQVDQLLKTSFPSFEFDTYHDDIILQWFSSRQDPPAYDFYEIKLTVEVDQKDKEAILHFFLNNIHWHVQYIGDDWVEKVEWMISELRETIRRETSLMEKFL